MKEIPESIQQMNGIKRRLVFQVIVVDSQVALIGEHFKRIPHKQHIASNDFDMNAAGIRQTPQNAKIFRDTILTWGDIVWKDWNDAWLTLPGIDQSEITETKAVTQ